MRGLRNKEEALRIRVQSLEEVLHTLKYSSTSPIVQMKSKEEEKEEH